MGAEELVEWYRLGSRLAELCPEKFTEIVGALRETVGVHELLAPTTWTFAAELISHLPQA